MANILYCMNTSWGWIKQRPHFIAEGLSKRNNVCVLSKHVPFSRKDATDTVDLHYFYRMPGERYKAVAFINLIIYIIQFFIYSRKFDIIWLSNPVDYRFARFFTSRKKIIYDCMDDQIELIDNPQRKKLVHRWEQLLYHRSDIVLASADFLKNVLISRYGEREIYVVNNAIKDGFGEASKESGDINLSLSDDEISISYIGTIASWMDWDLVYCVLKEIPNTKFHFFGPVDYKPSIDNPRIIFHGSLEHDKVPVAMANSKILIMPFVVNDLIKSVNPVKLYEYIYSGRPCIAPSYGESLKFGDFVYLYSDKKHCVEIIRKIVDERFYPKRSVEECKDFISNNTWSSRVDQIEKSINSLK